MIFYTVTTTGITLEIFINYFIYAIMMIGLCRYWISITFFLKKRFKYGITTIDTSKHR